MGKIVRIHPEARSGLIHWIEEHFHEIDSFLFIALSKDKTTMSIYHARSYLEAIGLSAVLADDLHEIAHEGEFECSEE